MKKSLPDGGLLCLFVRQTRVSRLMDNKKERVRFFQADVSFSLKHIPKYYLLKGEQD
jgi:hypothetical protein